MKGYQIISFCLLILLSYTCSGGYTTTHPPRPCPGDDVYYLVNTSEQNISIHWYKGAFLYDSNKVISNSEIIYSKYSECNEETGLRESPFPSHNYVPYDSVHVFSDDQVEVYRVEECEQPRNILCRSNHIVSDTILNGNYIYTWRFTWR